MDRERCEALQLRRLQSTVAWVYERVPHYRERTRRARVCSRGHPVARRRATAAVHRQDRASRHATRSACSPCRSSRWCACTPRRAPPASRSWSATRKGDLNTWTELHRAHRFGGGRHASATVAQMAFLYGMFTGGWGMHYGIERVGATVIPAGSGNTERQLMMMQDFGTTALVCTPSYALYIAEVAEKLGIDMREAAAARWACSAASRQARAMRDEIERRLGIRATDNYGLSEVMGPGVSGECEYQCGLHMAEDHFLLEVVDPETGEPARRARRASWSSPRSPRRPSRCCATARTTSRLIDRTPCACGRTHRPHAQGPRAHRRHAHHPRRERVPEPDRGRAAARWRASSRTTSSSSTGGRAGQLEIQIEVAEEIFSDAMKDMVAFTRTVSRPDRFGVGLQAKVTLVEPGTIERTAGKARRVIDRRQPQ